MVCNISHWLFAIAVVFGVSNTDSCDLLDSVPIVGGYITMPSGELLHQGVTYSSDQIFNSTKTLSNGTAVSAELHLRGCLCKVVQCIRLCCPVGYISDEGNCTRYEGVIPYHATVDIADSAGKFENVNLATHNDYKHRLATSKPCQFMYGLDPETEPGDNYTLMKVRWKEMAKRPRNL
jgi:Methuselah N-terminus